MKNEVQKLKISIDRRYDYTNIMLSILILLTVSTFVSLGIYANTSKGDETIQKISEVTLC